MDEDVPGPCVHTTIQTSRRPAALGPHRRSRQSGSALDPSPRHARTDLLGMGKSVDAGFAVLRTATPRDAAP